MKNLKEFKTNTWNKRMSESKGLDGFNNYSGTTDEEWCNYVVLLSQSRDSEILEQSNFQCALEQLGGESKDVVVERFGHWACGWFELLLVNPKSKQIKKAFEIYKALEEYPVLDEEDLWNRENEYHSEYANESKKDLAEALSVHFKIKNTKKLEDIAYALQIECQRYYGNDTCINIYDCRAPERTDVERLLTCMAQIKHEFNKSKVFKNLLNAAAVYGLQFIDNSELKLLIVGEK